MGLDTLPVSVFFFILEVNNNSADQTAYVSTSPLLYIENFLQALNNADKDGRIVVNRQGIGVNRRF